MALLVAAGLVAIVLTCVMIVGQVTVFGSAFAPAVSTHAVAQSSQAPVVPVKHHVAVTSSPTVSASATPSIAPSAPTVTAPANPASPDEPAAPAAPAPAQTIVAFKVTEDVVGTDNCPTNTTQDQMLITWTTTNASAVTLVYAESGFNPVSYSVAGSGSKILPQRCSTQVIYTLQASGSAPVVARAFPVTTVVIKPVVTITSYSSNYVNADCIQGNTTGTWGVRLSWTATGAKSGTISSPSLLVPLTSSQLTTGSYTFTNSCNSGTLNFVLTLSAPNAYNSVVQRAVPVGYQN